MKLCKKFGSVCIKIFLILLFPNILFAQLAEEVLYSNKDTLRNQTLYIMKQLDIEPRPNISRDSVLMIYIIDPKDKSGLAAYFDPGGTVVPNADSTLRYYRHPVIALQEPLYEVYSKQKDTTQIGLLITLSAVIHEMTHYLQKNFSYVSSYGINNFERYVSYLNDPSEREAHAVQSYYFLYYYDRAKLDIIMSTESNRVTRLARLLDAFKTYTDPSWVPIRFPSPTKID